MSGHVCHATGCKVAVPPAMFMCSRHWFMLPKPMRNSIWRVYRPGQEEDKQPSPEYIQTARACVKYLERIEAGL